jgi:hypothetical protein
MFQLARVAATVALFSSMASAQYQAYNLESNGALYGIDLGRVEAQLLGAVSGGLTNPRGLAYRRTTGEFWTYDASDRQVGIVFPAARTFLSRSVWQLAPTRSVDDVCWDPTTDRILLIDEESGTRLVRLTGFSPASGIYTTIATWTRAGQNQFTDIACDAVGNVWLLGGSPWGLHVMEPGRTAPRFLTSTRFASGLAIERSSGSFYALIPDLLSSSSLALIDPATGATRSLGFLFQLSSGLEVIEGACNSRLASYGTGCPGSGGYTPELSASGCYNASGYVHLGLSQAPSGSTALLLFGLAPTSFPIGNGCNLLIAPVFNDPQIALPLFGSGGAGRGFTAIGLSIPPGVVTTSLVTQVFMLDPGAAGGFTMTNGVKLD